MVNCQSLGKFPRPKRQRNPKHQVPNHAAEAPSWRLRLGAYLGFGFWSFHSLSVVFSFRIPHLNHGSGKCRNPNDECRKNVEARMTKSFRPVRRLCFRHSVLGILFVIWDSSFVSECHHLIDVRCATCGQPAGDSGGNCKDQHNAGERPEIGGKTVETTPARTRAGRNWNWREIRSPFARLRTRGGSSLDRPSVDRRICFGSLRR